jgi:hypothetical protein
MSASDFGSLSITLQSPKTTTETLPVEISALRKVWHTLTRKPRPVTTFERPHFHTIKVCEYDDAAKLSDILTRAESQGYTVPSVIVNSVYGTDELVNGRTPAMAEIMALFEAIQDDEYQWAAYVAYVQDSDHGWNVELSETWRKNVYHGEYESPEAFAQYWAWETSGDVNVPKGSWGETESKTLMDALPKYLSIDWTETAEALEGDGFTFIRYNGMTHVYSF